MLKNLRKKAQGMVEYAILLAGVALIAISSVSILGEKTTGLIATTAFVLPGASETNNGPIFVGKLVETTDAVQGGTAADAIKVDLDQINSNTGFNRVDINVYQNEFSAIFPDILPHN